MSDETSVSDSPEHSRYEIFFEGELAGFAEYRLKDGLIFFVHTEVFDRFGGKGLGSILAQGALDAVAADGSRQVVPLCPFIKGWIEKHPDYQSLVSVREA